MTEEIEQIRDLYDGEIELPQQRQSQYLGHTIGTDTWTLSEGIEFFARRVATVLPEPPQA